MKLTQEEALKRAAEYLCIAVSLSEDEQGCLLALKAEPDKAIDYARKFLTLHKI